MAMSENLKQRLREHQQAKRAATHLLKDVTPQDLLMACDAVMDGTADPRFDVPLSVEGRWVAYLSRATPGQIRALSSILPHGEVNIGGYVGWRTVFDAETLRQVLRFLRVSDLTRGWEGKHVKALRHPFGGSMGE